LSLAVHISGAFSCASRTLGKVHTCGAIDAFASWRTMIALLVVDI